MPRPDRMITEKEAAEILKNGTYGVLSTSSPEGEPYGVPVNYVFVPEENALYFHCAKTGKKMKNLKADGRVSFVTVGSKKIIPERYTTHYESAIVTGTAEILENEEEKKEKLRLLCRSLAPQATQRLEEVIRKYLPAVAVVRIRIRQITGKRNRDD